MNIQPYIKYFEMEYNFIENVKYDLHYAFLQNDFSNNRQLFERNYNIFIQITTHNFTIENLLNIFDKSTDIRIKNYKMEDKSIYFEFYDKYIELEIENENTLAEEIKCIKFKSTKPMDDFFWTFDEISDIQNNIFDLIGRNCNLVFERK